MIYLIRHGQTEFNKVGRYQGRLDAPLTELGVEQARRVGAWLKGRIGDPQALDFQTSPLGRARRTAEIIAEALGAPPARVDERLTEIDFGSWEGLTREEIYARSPEVAAERVLFLRSQDGEQREALEARVLGWLGEMSALPPDRPCVAVSHAGVGRMMRGLYLGLSLEDIRAMDTPQDAVFVLGGGHIERFECPPLPSAVTES